MHTEENCQNLETKPRADRGTDVCKSLTPFPPYAMRQATVMPRQKVEQCWPAFITMLSALQDHAETRGLSPRMIGVIGSRNVLGGVSHHEVDAGKALVLCLPGLFESCLSQLAEQAPYITVTEDLDQLENRSVFCWACTVPDGRSFHVSTPAYPIDQSGVLNRQNAAEVFVPVVFVAGSSIAWGGFQFTETDEWDLCEAMNICLNFRPYRDYNKEELRTAACRAELAGSAQPWTLQPWMGQDGIFRMEIPLFGLLK